MSSLEKMVSEKLDSASSETDLLQVTSIAANLLHQEAIEEPFFLSVCAIAQLKMGSTEFALQLIGQAIDLAPESDDLYIAKALIVGSMRGEAVEPVIKDFQIEFTNAISKLRDLEASLELILDNLGFTKIGDPIWKDLVFDLFVLPILQYLINKRMSHMALVAESLIFSRYLRTGGVENESRFMKSTKKWYPLMERLGQSLAVEKNLKTNNELRLYNNKLAFFIHSESMLAHIGTVFSILDSYKKRGKRDFEVKVISFSGYSKEMRDAFRSYEVEVISLERLYPGTTWDQRFLALRAFLEQEEIEILFWVCLTVHMSFAFGLRIAPEQIWYTVSYYRGLTNKEIDRRLLTTVLADKVFEGNNQWEILNYSIAGACKNEADVEDEIVSIKKELLGEKFNNVIGVLAREQKLQDKSYIKAIAQVLKRNPETLFVWTGTRCDETVESHINDFGIADQCKYLGWVDTSIYVHVLDIFMDTFPFPCGVTLYQAMAAGKASVSLRTEDAISMGIHGQLLSAFESRSEFHFRK